MGKLDYGCNYPMTIWAAVLTAAQMVDNRIGKRARLRADRAEHLADDVEGEHAPTDAGLVGIHPDKGRDAGQDQAHNDRNENDDHGLAAAFLCRGSRRRGGLPSGEPR